MVNNLLNETATKNKYIIDKDVKDNKLLINNVKEDK